MEGDKENASETMSLVNGVEDISKVGSSPASNMDSSSVMEPTDVKAKYDPKKMDQVIENGVNDNDDDDSNHDQQMDTDDAGDGRTNSTENGNDESGSDNEVHSGQNKDEDSNSSSINIEKKESFMNNTSSPAVNDEDDGSNGTNEQSKARNSYVGKIDEKSDSEKENTNLDNVDKKLSNSGAASPISSLDKNEMSNDNDLEIIGESKAISISTPSNSKSSSQNAIVSPSPTLQNSFNGLYSNSPSPSMANSSHSSPSFPGMMLGGPGNNPASLMVQPSSAPPKPKSSLDQIELIRWEIQNRINTRPKYFKPNPSAELGPLAKFLFDIGSDLIKESVYRELVKIQSKKQDEDKLSEKEKEDLEKLKDIERDLNSTVGHLKLKMKKRCKTCQFQTESGNVMYHHKQFPHEDGKVLFCAYCKFATKQSMSFKFHMEAEHIVQPRLHDKKFLFECDLCQYENNQEQKLDAHKQRCSKQYRPLFNLHPSCLSGAEINLCLENIFYRPVVPKNLKILQQKHLQQQAALAEARRQQAEVAKLAAQKNAAQQAALAKQRQQQRAMIQSSPRFSAPPNIRHQYQPRVQTPPMSQMRFNNNTRTPSPARSMTPMRHPSKMGAGLQSHHGNAPVGFEVCEICGGYVKDRKALRIHFFYAHRIDLPLNLFDRNQPPLYCATCSVRFWTANGLRKHLDVHAQEKRMPEGYMSDGVSGKCIACGQLVGNIVVHMRVVHNREIHHYINALMCMFCGASFNSHANVERHIKDVHGTIDIATGAVKAKGRMKASPAPMPKIQPPPKRPAQSNNSLVKGSVCVLCNLNFGRNVDLTRHCMRTHHTCMKCGMVVIDKDSLLKHTCLTSPSGTRDCTMCSEVGFHPAYYVKHLRDKHLKKFTIDVARVSVPVIERWIKRPYSFKGQSREEFVEISDSDEEEVQVNVKPSPVGPPKKKARIGPACKINRPRLINGGLTNGVVSTSEDNKNPDASLVESSFGGVKRKSLDSSVSEESPSKLQKTS